MTYESLLKGATIIETVLQKKMGERQLEVYYTLLKEIPDFLFEKGIVRMLKERVYTNIPAPAEILNYCIENKEEDLLIKATEAKQKLKTAIGCVGTYATVAFDDPILHLMIRDIGGWVKLGSMKEQEFEDYLKFKFEKLYKAYATRKNNDIPLQFQGIAQSQEVTYVGNKEKAIAWIGQYEKKFEEIEGKFKISSEKLSYGGARNEI